MPTDNYIGKIDAEWVDPGVSVPHDGWVGDCRIEGTTETFRLSYEDGDFIWCGSPQTKRVRAWLRLGGPIE